MALRVPELPEMGASMEGYDLLETRCIVGLELVAVLKTKECYQLVIQLELVFPDII